MVCNIKFHAEASKVFNGDAEIILKAIKIAKSSSKNNKQKRIGPEHYISNTISIKDIIGPIQFSKTNYLGIEKSKYFQVGERFYGLNEVDYPLLLKLSKSIHNQKIIRDKVSFNSIREYVFDWVKESYNGFIQSDLCSFLLNKFNENIIDHEIWVPVANLNIQKEFEVGKVQFKSVSDKLFGIWNQNSIEESPELKKEIDIVYETYRKKYLGYAAGVILINAERVRANEIALLEAEIAVSLLRFFSPANIDPLLSSNTVLSGREFIKKDVTLEIKNNSIEQSSSGIIENYPISWLLSNDQINEITQLGSNNISNLLTTSLESQFKEKVLECLLLYSKVSINKELPDKLVYLFSSIEGMMLKNNSEPLQSNLGTRIAFTIGKNLEHRKAIIKNVNKVYDVRSKFLHHGQSISEIESLKEFMGNVWETFSFILSHISVYETKEEFIESIDDKRLS